MWKWQSQVMPWSLHDESFTTCAEAGATAGPNIRRAAAAKRIVIFFIARHLLSAALDATRSARVQSNPGTMWRFWTIRFRGTRKPRRQRSLHADGIVTRRGSGQATQRVDRARLTLVPRTVIGDAGFRDPVPRF